MLSKLQPWAQSGCLCEQPCIGTQWWPFICMLSVAAFVVATETYWPAKNDVTFSTKKVFANLLSIEEEKMNLGLIYPATDPRSISLGMCLNMFRFPLYLDFFLCKDF